MQHTLRSITTISGIGLHSGLGVDVVIHPAPAHHGIVFKRTDAGNALIPALWHHVSETTFATKICNRFLQPGISFLDQGKPGQSVFGQESDLFQQGATSVSVSTIEHLMAAFSFMEIDNALVELSGPEVPILDGSAKPFIDLMLAAGLQSQAAPRKYLRILKEVRAQDNAGRYALLRPSDQRRFSVEIDFNGRGLPSQTYTLSDFSHFHQVMDTRTFGFYEDAEKMWGAGLSKGVSLENTVIFKEGSVLNSNGLRYEDECVRHKILDAVGDLSLAGMPILGDFHGKSCGHDLNNKLLREVFSQPDAWTLVDGPVVVFLKAFDSVSCFK